ncbi:MAG: glycosyltransferase [Acidimicrobiales bacterium]
MTIVVPSRGRILVIVSGREPTAPALDGLRAVAVAHADIQQVQVEPGAAAVNRAATVERNDYLVLVDSATPVPPGAIEAAVEALRADASVGLAGWSPGGRVAGTLELFTPLSLCVLRHSAFHAVAGLHPDLTGPIAAVDLGWRLWLAGYRVRSIGPAPASLMVGGDAPAEAHTDEMLSVLATMLDDTSLEPAAWTEPAAARARPTASGRRGPVQAGRRRGDGEMLPLAHGSIAAWAEVDPVGAVAHDVMVRWGAPERAGSRRRIAVVTADTLAARMAGPGIRALQIARRLHADHDVVLATTGRCELAGQPFEVRGVAERGLKDLERWCDVFLFQGWILAGRAALLESDKVVIADVYDPMHLEQLEQARDAEGERGRFDAVRNAGTVLNEQLGRADFMLCASAKQRDLWLGQLAALGRINPVTYDGDESLARLLAVVPFGVGDEPPQQTRSAIRGAVEGIGLDDKVVLWGGGVYNWFDPLTLIRAVDRVRHRVPGIRLYFLGLRHPNPDIPEMRMAVETRALADELGLTDVHVFFNHDWVAFDERQDYLLDADIGVSTHLDHIETEFSFRTRILDYLWAGLPILATEGDSFAQLILQEELGIVVAPNDVDAVEAGLERLLTDHAFATACRERVATLTPGLRWEVCLEPLVAFCREARRAADVACQDLDPHSDAPPVRRGRRRDIEVAWAYLRAGGPRLVWDRAMARVLRNRR